MNERPANTPIEKCESKFTVGQFRPRRLRGGQIIRKMVQENVVRLEDLVMPFFVCPGEKVQQEIPSMPGNYRFSIDILLEQVRMVGDLGIPAVLLFGIPEEKDYVGSSGYDIDGIIPRAIRALKDAYVEPLLIADVCLCEYTNHGHCGILTSDDLEDGDSVDNDKTIEILAQEAVVYAAAGADIIAPSDMMDGRIRRIRIELDECGYSDIPIMSYAAKYASAFYGPFRDAADSAPERGDRRSYQMDPPNSREAMREIELDVSEGADIVMVKPALAYLDVLRDARQRFDVPLAAYNVSGEYAMIKAAAANGWVDEIQVRDEILVSIKRAGADLIITYFAVDVARTIR